MCDQAPRKIKMFRLNRLPYLLYHEDQMKNV